MIPLVKPYFPPREELMPALEEIIYSGYVATGQPVYDFEDKFKAYIGNPNIISVHSGTDALHLAYILAGIKAGDEVISTPMTAEPTNTTIAMVGAKVVWGDVDPQNGLLDPNSVRSLITEKTKAIVLVHYAGVRHGRVLQNLQGVQYPHYRGRCPCNGQQVQWQDSGKLFRLHHLLPTGH